MRIAIYLNNNHIPERILENPELGNPGVGGTQFLLFSLPWYMHKFYPGKYEFAYIVEKSTYLKTSNSIFVVDNMVHGAQLAKQNNYDLFIFPPGYNAKTLDLLDRLPEIAIDSIAWMHNTPLQVLNKLRNCPNILRAIAVGRVQYEKLRDHDIFKKLILISNPIDINAYNYNSRLKKQKWVVFLGSLDFSKGFHHLAKIWKKILATHPDAELHVIGSGKMYDDNLKTGESGLIESSYEVNIRKYLNDKNGRLLSSVYFHGLLGKEKNEIITKAAVGIANHPFVSETFCLGAAEIQALGTPVVSAPRGGLLDTVENNKTGFLRNTARKRREKIELLLRDSELSKLMGEKGREHVKNEFSYKEFCSKWDGLFNDLNSKQLNQIQVRNGLTNYREFLRRLKAKSILFNVFLIPSIYILHFFEYLRLKIDRLKYTK